MFLEDSPDLPDDEGVGLAEMAAVDQELRGTETGTGPETGGPKQGRS